MCLPMGQGAVKYQSCPARATGTKEGYWHEISAAKPRVSAWCRTGQPASARWSLTAEAAPGPWRPDRRPVSSKPSRRCIRISGARRQRPAADLPSPQLVEAQATAPPASGNQRNRCMKTRSTEQGLITAPAASGTPPAPELVGSPGSNRSGWGCCSIQRPRMIRTHAAGRDLGEAARFVRLVFVRRLSGGANSSSVCRTGPKRCYSRIEGIEGWGEALWKAGCRRGSSCRLCYYRCSWSPA
jgi:hypothetical protein